MAKNQIFFKNALKRIFPFPLRATLQNYIILSRDYGQFRSMRDMESVNARGEPIPWYSYPAVEYLKQLDLSDKVVFEYGSGNSTRFYAARCLRVAAVEDDPTWYSRLREELPANVDYQLCQDPWEYVQSIHRYPAPFDIIIIDGMVDRYKCAVEALKKLRPDGFIILDNSDWKEFTSALLRSADLIEVDMSGFGPINSYTTTTSFFFTRSVQLKATGFRQPLPGIGAKEKNESDPSNT